MKSVLLLGQIMFYLRIFNSQAQLGTRDIQKLDLYKLYLLQKSQNSCDMLPGRPIVPYCGEEECVEILTRGFTRMLDEVHILW